MELRNNDAIPQLNFKLSIIVLLPIANVCYLCNFHLNIFSVFHTQNTLRQLISSSAQFICESRRLIFSRKVRVYFTDLFFFLHRTSAWEFVHLLLFLINALTLSLSPISILFLSSVFCLGCYASWAICCIFCPWIYLIIMFNFSLSSAINSHEKSRSPFDSHFILSEKLICKMHLIGLKTQTEAHP